MAILHRNRTFSTLMPRYAERFRCIGPSCEDTCCIGWPVHIDKKTYKAYRSHPHPALKPMISVMQRVDNPLHPGMYAVLPVGGPEGSCPALQDGKCAIHTTVGASYLSDTCDSYPRINRYINQQVEQSLTLSCPEAARQALLAEDAFEFIEAPVNMREGAVFSVTEFPGLTPAVMNELRIFCMNLMRTRELPLWQRLALLGTFCDVLDRTCANDGPGAAEALIENFVLNIENGTLLAALEPIQANYEAQAMVFTTLWASKGFSGASPYQQVQMNRIATGLGGDANGQVSAAQLVAAYRHGLGKLDEAIAEAPWLLEHFLLNEMFAQQFPVGALCAYDSYLRLLARFGLLRLLLAAQCNAEETLPSMDTIIATVELQARRFQHDPQFTQEVNLSLRASGWADLDKVAGLVRM